MQVTLLCMGACWILNGGGVVRCGHAAEAMLQTAGVHAWQATQACKHNAGTPNYLLVNRSVPSVRQTLMSEPPMWSAEQ